MSRIKLFGSSSPRISLFSKDGSREVWQQCSDCGYKFKTNAHTTNHACPRCGGTRFNVMREFFSPENCPEKVPDNKVKLFETEEENFQKEFNETSDELELKLKEFSGSSLSLLFIFEISLHQR